MKHFRPDVAVCETPNSVPARHALASKGTCYAPVFKASSALTCLLFSILNLLILLTLIVLLIVTLGSRDILCLIRRIQFRLKHCRTGNSDPAIPLGDPYAQHVHSFRMLYGKDSAWEQWMLANRSRYEPIFEGAEIRPAVMMIAFRYDSAPIAYNPPWTSETQHMNALASMSELAYAGYDFQFTFEGNTSTSYANVIAGIPTNASNASGKNVYLYYEGIFNHEFGHVMGVPHHYDTIDDVGAGQHMPPGETGCLMDRNEIQYCSACRTALFIPLNVDNAAAIADAVDVINDRYPY
ncbi:MAG: hypothetical protein AABN95_21940 [Acidobacteriota bacterium]